MVAGNDDGGLWLYSLIQDLLGGIGFITLVFFMTFGTFAAAYSWRQFSPQGLRKAGDDLAFSIIDRYASTRLFKVHAAIYMSALVVFAMDFLIQQLG